MDESADNPRKARGWRMLIVRDRESQVAYLLEKALRRFLVEGKPASWNRVVVERIIADGVRRGDIAAHGAARLHSLVERVDKKETKQ